MAKRICNSEKYITTAIERVNSRFTKVKVANEL